MVLPQLMRDGGFFSLASNERSQCDREALWRSRSLCCLRGNRFAATARAHGLKEERPVIFAKIQRFGKQAQSAFVRCPPRSSLKGADSANTDPCALGEFFLCETGSHAIALQ